VGETNPPAVLANITNDIAHERIDGVEIILTCQMPGEPLLARRIATPFYTHELHVAAEIRDRRVRDRAARAAGGASIADQYHNANPVP
jgi:hypothetical protein